MTPLSLAQRLVLCAILHVIQDWERAYLLTKARHLHDAGLLVDHHKANGVGHSVRVAAVPSYLQSRVRWWRSLPSIEIVGPRGSRASPVTKVVAEYVVGDIKPELFLEVVEMMGMPHGPH